MLLPLLCSGISMTFTNAFYIETIFEMASNIKNNNTLSLLRALCRRHHFVSGKKMLEHSIEIVLDGMKIDA